MSTATIDQSILRPTTVHSGRGRGGTTFTVLTDGETFYCGSTGCDYAAEKWNSVFGHRARCKHKGNVLILPRQVEMPDVERVDPSEAAPAVVAVVEPSEVDEAVEVGVVEATVTGQDLQRRVEKLAAKAATISVTNLVSADLTVAAPIETDWSLVQQKVAPGSTSSEQPASRAVRAAWTSIEAVIEEEVQRRLRRVTEAARGEHTREVKAERARADEWRKRALDAEGQVEAIKKAVGLAAA